MPAVVSISAWKKAFLAEKEEWAEEFGGEVSQTHVDCLVEILTNMRQGMRRNNYEVYAPSLNLSSSPRNRSLVGQVLYFIWHQCQEAIIPELNFLVINKRSRYPGRAMIALWKDTYGSLEGYKEFCDARAKEAARFLDAGWVVITD